MNRSFSLKVYDILLICSQYKSDGKALFYTDFRPVRLMKMGSTFNG